jgi:transposase
MSANTYFLGFDVSKAKLDVSFINERGIEQWIDNLPNNTVDVATFLLTVSGNYPGDSIICMVESTGSYHYAVVEGAMLAGVPCRLYNPILTKQQTKATIRGKKTDRTDAFLAARVGWSGGGRQYLPEPYMAARHYARSCQKLTKLSSSFMLHHAYLGERLEEGLSPDAKAAYADVQRAITEAKLQLRKEMASAADSDIFKLLQSIPGIGPYVAASFIGEIQNMARFPSAKALIAFAGLDPRIRQSGKSLNFTGRLTKRGSNYLRHSLFIAANVARIHNPQFRAVYEKKRNEGKPHTVAVVVVARKLLAVMRAVWLSGEKYDCTKTNALASSSP